MTERGLYEPCKRCKFKRYHRCPYERYMSDDGTMCGAFEMSTYHKKKERELEQAQRLGTLLNEKGVTPKYKLGDIVYRIAWGEDYPEKLQIRRIDVSEDLKYRYKVKGHNEYSYGESDLYATEAECMQVIIEKFMNDTMRRAKNMQEYCKMRGIEGMKLKMLDK